MKHKSINTLSLFLIIALCLPAIVNCQSEILKSQKEEITTFIKEAMQDLEITGAAVAVIKDNNLVYKNYIGTADLEHNVPISDTSLFRLHSLSKIFVSVGIFQLIEQGEIALEDNISEHLSDLPKKWNGVKIKHLLSHSSGLPDMRDEKSRSEDVATKNIYGRDIQFPPGERASYNQTNFWLLNRLIREITNGSFERYITSQFEEDSEVCFSNSSDIVPNRVIEYKPDNEGRLKEFHFMVPEFMYGAIGITMSLDDLIEWDKKLNENSLISEKSKKKMFSPFQYQVGTGFTYGWDKQTLNGIDSYGFNGGGLVNYRIFPCKGISVIWFSNGYRIPHNVDNITNRIVGCLDQDLVDTTPAFISALTEVIGSGKSVNLEDAYFNLKEKFPYVHYENVLNRIGYKYMSKKDINNAIALFRLNVKEFPHSSNAYDSLAEGYYTDGQLELSKINYLKSLELNPSNSNATLMLKKIEKEK